MLLGTVIFIAGLIVALVALIYVVKLMRDSELGGAIITILVAVFVGGGLIFGPMVGSVDTKKVGVVTSFKKPTGEVKSAGGYMKAPWKSVHEMDAAAQTEAYEFDVQGASGTTVHLRVLPRWNMIESAAPDLFQNYKDFDGVKESLFKNTLVVTANDLFAGYSALNSVDPKTGLPIKSKETWSTELKQAMDTKLAGKINIDSLSIPTIKPDDKSQAKIDAQVAEIAQGRILDQQKLNADKQADITVTNAKVDKQTRCLEIAEKVGGQPGLCLSSSTGVIVDTKK
jgi:SPFH domain/Band 7 family protein